MKFFKRTDRELDRDLQSLRSKPSDDLILRISGRILRSHSPAARSNRVKVGLAMGLTALGVIVFAVFGGLGYASSAASKATSVVSVVKVTSNSPTTVSVNSLPAPTTTTTTTTSPSGSKVITWTGNGTTGGLCSSVTGSGSYQTWDFVLTSPYNGSGSTLSATFATAGSRTVTVTSTTSGSGNGSYHLPVTTGKGDRLLSASATNGSKNSVLTVSGCVLNGTTTTGGGSGGGKGDDSKSGDSKSGDDNSSGGSGGGGSSCGGSGGGGSDDGSSGGSKDSTSSKGGSKDSKDSGKSDKHIRSVASSKGGSSGGSSSSKDDSKDSSNDSKSGGSSDDNSSGGKGGGGGAGGDQYGGCIPICHTTSVGKYVLMLVSSADLAYHRAHGDIVPAPSTGCPGNDDSKSGGSKCNSGRGNGSEGDSSQLIKPGTGSKGTSPTKDCDPGNSGGKDKGGD